MPLKLTAKQAQGLALLQDPQKEVILFTGGSRSGKTFLIMEYMISRAFQFPGSRQLIVRKNLVDTRGSIWDDSLPKYLSLYIPATGGAAALLARSVQECVLVAYEDLGPEAILRLRVEGFPAVVVVDPLGTDLYDVGPREARRALGVGD